MKKLLLILLLTNTLFAQSDYYYYNDEKIFLTKAYQQVNIVTVNAFDENSLNESEVQEFSMNTEKEIRNGEYKKIANIEFTTTPNSQSEYNQKINELKSINNIEGVYPYYLYNGNIIGTNNFFVVKLKQASDISLLQNVASQKNVDIIRQRTYLPLWYILSTNTSTTENSVELSAFFYETGYFDAVEPAFTGAFTIDPIEEDNSTNPAPLETCYLEEEGNFDNFQWNLFDNEDFPLADINVCGAWDLGVFGQGVTVAVVDTGIGDEIIDLPASYPGNVIPSSGLPFSYNFYYGVTGLGWHGTSVASIIGAKHNGVGMGGIAPDAEMLHVANELLNTFNQIEIADGIDEAVNRQAGVFNMSFANNGSPSSYLEEALDNALDNGRGGLGSVLVASSGNNPSNTVQQPANYPRVLAVGGTGTQGNYNAYNYGDELDIVAPSASIVALGLNGSAGNNFGGTSAASPHVAGVAALMISANSGIAGEGVRNIIKRTAQRGSDVTYGDENAWYTKTGPRNDHLGHGIVDATKCVLTAQAFDTEVLN